MHANITLQPILWPIDFPGMITLTRQVAELLPPEKGYHQRVEELHHSLEDHRLHVAVVGEFSSGKSTFLNALLRRDLLKRDVLQGTTVSPTYIHYFSYLERESVAGEAIHSGEQFTARLHQLTSIEQHRAVEVKIRSDCILDQVILIDTPGLNSTNSGHSEITRNCLKEDADLLMIITDCNAPLSLILTTFLEEHASDRLDQCLVFATKCDMLDPEEVERVQNYLGNRLKSELKAQPGLIAAVSPLAVLVQLQPHDYDMVRKRLGDEDIAKYVESFQEAESKINNLLHKERWNLLSKRHERKIKRLFKDLHKDLNVTETDLRKQEFPDYKTAVLTQRTEIQKVIALATQQVKQRLTYPIESLILALNTLLLPITSYNQFQPLMREMVFRFSCHKDGVLGMERAIIEQVLGDLNIIQMRLSKAFSAYVPLAPERIRPNALNFLDATQFQELVLAPLANLPVLDSAMGWLTGRTLEPIETVKSRQKTAVESAIHQLYAQAEVIICERLTVMFQILVYHFENQLNANRTFIEQTAELSEMRRDRLEKILWMKSALIAHSSSFTQTERAERNTL